jgi:hypothetical protein
VLYQAMAEPLYAGQHRRRSLRKVAERLVELLQDSATFQDQVRWSSLKKEDGERASGALPGGAARNRSTNFGGVGENFAGIDGVPPSNFRLMDMLIFDPIDKLDNDPDPNRLVLSPMVELAQEAVRGYAARQGGGRRKLHMGAFSKKDEQKRLTIRRGGNGSMPRVGESVRIVGGEHRKGETGTLIEDDGSGTPFKVKFSDSETKWFVAANVALAGSRPHVFVGGVERRVLWFRRVERTQEERDLIVQQKGAKDIEKRMWREWHPPEMEDALIVKVDELVGGTIHVVREPRPGERIATSWGGMGFGTSRTGSGAIPGTSRSGAIPGTSRAGYGAIPGTSRSGAILGTSRAGYGAIPREPILTRRGNI